MKRARAGIFVIAGLLAAHAAFADFELTAPDGRRVLLKSDNTWQYVEGKDAPDADKRKAEGELVLLLERKTERDNSCRFRVQLANKLPYEVQNLVLHYSAYRANGVVYDTVSSGRAFGSLKPGDSQAREFEFYGLPCRDIARVQVVGGDRCAMGELHRWLDQTEHKGQCLAKVRVAESELVRFDK
jgi:hypothetical protein